MTPTALRVKDHNDVRLVQFDFLRATEMAALNSMSWIGKGDKEAADAAACDAIRGVFDDMDIRGEVVIGEGIKDQAPGLFAGERVGTWSDGSPRFDVALDPLDGTTNLSKGLPNAISCIAAALRCDEAVPALQHVPAFYMKKLSYPPSVRKAWIQDSSLPLDVNAPISDVISLTARLLGKNIRDVVVMVLDRPRNSPFIQEIRSVGASLRMIGDGDISAALAPAIPNSGVDLYVGIGGAPEGILAAAGLRCMGGGMQAQMWARDAAEMASLVECGWNDHVENVYRSRDLVHGDDILFIATGICDSPLLRGVRVRGSTVITHSVLMRMQSGSIRYVQTEHDLSKRPVRLRSTSEIGPRCVENSNRVATPPRSHVKPSERFGQLAAAADSPKSDISGILLFGAPGSGKGTIGQALGKLPGFLHCSSGDLIRSAVKMAGNDEGRWAPMAHGALVPDADLWELFDLFVERTMRRSANAGGKSFFLIDGIPRCRSQVSKLSQRVRVCGVYYFDCGNRTVLLQRLRERSMRESRNDDVSDEVVRQRLQLFEEQTLPLLGEYPQDIVHRIDASQPPEKVLGDILTILNRTKLTQARRPAEAAC